MFCKNKFFLSIIILAVGAFFLPLAVEASGTSGTIDSTYKYAWGEKIGWINFGAANGGVSITDSAITGYAWSANYGWINLAPAGSGVKNDGEGNLSGSAWGEDIGWITFDGVKIGTNGEFTGYATTTNLGVVNFNCNNPHIANTCASSDFKIKTDWRPISARNSSLPADFLNPPVPAGGSAGSANVFIILINNGAGKTASPIVALLFNDGTSKNMAISNTADFSNASQQAYASPIQWNLCSKSGSITEAANCASGSYTVYAKFYSKYGVPSPIVSASIIFAVSASTSPKAEIEPINRGSSSVGLIGTTSAAINQITADEANNILSVISSSSLSAAENKIYQQIIFSAKISENEKLAIADFIHSGTPTTLKLGAGERAGSVSSFQSAFNRSPVSLVDWQDVIKIASGRWPAQYSTSSEARAKANFKIVYSRNPKMTNAFDNAAVTIMAYGLRPAMRNSNSEKSAIKSFRFIYRRSPVTAREWDVVRAIAYSGAKR